MTWLNLRCLALVTVIDVFNRSPRCC